ncbi:MAG: FtsQ-type POTRA domain-containing protein [Oceanospirillaceae bacterium]|nr:FtsQ-type POTRA domain-containing protein [Oceanospirillaceae bacterium]
MGSARRIDAASAAPPVVPAGGWLKPVLLLTALGLFAGLLWALAQQVWHWLDRPVAEVRVVGEARHLDRVALAERLAAGLNAPLLQLDLAQLEERVLEEPWVHGARLKRNWPPAIEVRIDEEVPVARWGDKGLLNHQGDIFWPELKPEYQALPRLNGPASDTGRVMAQFHDLTRMFQSAGLRLNSLTLEARGAWTLELDNGMRVVVGRERVAERLGRFLSIYRERLAAEADRIEQVDIRYTNGVAVKWKPEQDEAEKAAG